MRNAAKYANEKVDLQGIQIRIFKLVVVAFAWEEAVDGGCPIREFFQLLIREIRESSIFQGCWFSNDLGLLASRHYELAGKLGASFMEEVPSAVYHL